MIGPAEIFTFLFVMLGPLKLLGPFVQRTRGLDDATVRQIAFWAFLIATAGIVAGGLIGRATDPRRPRRHRSAGRRGSTRYPAGGLVSANHPGGIALARCPWCVSRETP